MKAELIAQYQKALLMLIDCIRQCPQELWNDTAYDNCFWRIAYHTLYFTDLYLSDHPDAHIPWEKHISGYNFLGKINYIENRPLTITTVYTQHDLMIYAENLISSLPARIKEDWSTQSGFDWLPMSLAGLYFYNLRHLQHHIGQLTERLKTSNAIVITWQ